MGSDWDRSFLSQGDENVQKLIVEMDAQLCECSQDI